MTLVFSLIQNEGNATVTLLHDGKLYGAPSSHPNFNAIAAACLASQAGDEVDSGEVAELFDVAAAVKRSFERLGRRVSVEGDSLYFDGDPVESFLADQILRFLDAGEDVGPLVNFMEKCENNPTDHSREQLYAWLRKHQFTITAEGDIVGYKGVRKNDTGYVSVRSGPARVNGVAVDGQVPNNPGDIVEMPRSSVVHDPNVACSVGLHVATYSYASTWTNVDAVLEVHVNPTDVVSVPNDCGGEKIRTSRYTVVGAVEKPYDGPITPTDSSRTATVGLDLTFDVDAPEDALVAGDRVTDTDGDEGTVEADSAGDLTVKYDNSKFGSVPVSKAHKRSHGKGGATSQAAKGRGRNPHQDNAGRYTAGRPGSQRDKGGRFAA